MNDEPRFDRLAEPDVVRDEKIDVRHHEGADERIELVRFDLEPPAAERGLEDRGGALAFGVRDRAPPRRVEERFERRV